MAFSLRLPPALDNEARIRAEQLGVPLNAVICFALDLYLRGGSAGQPSAVLGEIDTANPLRVSRGGMPLKPRSSQGVIAKLGAQPSQHVFELDGVPLPPGPGSSKAERQAYTAYLRSQRKNGR